MESTRSSFRGLATAVLAGLLAADCGGAAEKGERPNILLVLTDDHSWIHVGCYGDPGVRTPNIDRLAREGVRFENAHAACSSCVASRSALLTGQAIWRLEEGGVFGGTLPRKFPVYPLELERGGYHVGWTGKGWGPGNLRAGGWGNDYPQGRVWNRHVLDEAQRDGLEVAVFDYAANFEAFLDARPADAPFSFWCGATEPHPPYAEGAGLAAGKRLQDARVPGHLPDGTVVRSEILDHYLEIEYLDRVLGTMLAALERRGLAEDTLVVVTSDNGIALPRSKGTLYDMGTRVPLVVRWPRSVPPGRVVVDPVVLTDLAPTFLEAAGLPLPAGLTGHSLLALLHDAEEPEARDFVVTGMERHGFARPGALGYPMRALSTERWLYVRNFEPGRRAAGDPDFASPINRRRRGYLEVADTPTKRWMLENRDDPRMRPYVERCFGSRPAEELYDRETDAAQVVDLATDPAHAKVLADLRRRLDERLAATDDPRSRGESPWDGYGWDSAHWRVSTFGPR